MAGLLALTSAEPLGSINSLRNMPGAFSGMGICGLYVSAAGLAQPKGGLQVKQVETGLPASLGKLCLGRRWGVFWTDWRRVPICRSRSTLGRVQASRRRLRTGGVRVLAVRSWVKAASGRDARSGPQKAVWTGGGRGQGRRGLWSEPLGGGP